MKRIRWFVALMLACLPFVAEAQFGKNKVVWEKAKRSYYQSAHFDVYLVDIDLNDPTAKENFNLRMGHLEDTYTNFSQTMGVDFKQRMPVIMFKTYNQFENNHIVGSFLPEGVGAFAEPIRNRLVLRLDFEPDLQDTITSHETFHIFEFYFLSMNIIHRVISVWQIPDWVMEGGADYMAASFAPYTRDDIRGMLQRVAAGNPEKYLPTWEMLENGQGDPYSMGAMFFMFLEGKYGKDVPIKFLLAVLKDRRHDLIKVMFELTNGEIDSEETFDRLQRDYWSSKYSKDMREKPKPYSETASIKSTSLTPAKHAAPILSPVPSPDGKRIAFFSVGKYGPALMVEDLTVLAEEKKNFIKKSKSIRNLTPQLPLKNFEYVVAQKLITWPFGGFDLAWSPDGTQIAFFARKGRDHKLFIIESQKGKILQEIELCGFDATMDQGFSPAFSPDGKTIYFSASQNLDRNIYSLDLTGLKAHTYTNLSNLVEGTGSFDVAPIPSPDGKSLVFMGKVGSYQKIFLMDLVNYTKEQITFGRSNEEAPSFSEDGKTLLFTSDRGNGVWNIYTMDLVSREVKQWNDLFGGTFTPRFMPGSTTRITYSAYYEYHQVNSHIYPSFELFEGTLKEPLKVQKEEEKGDSYEIAFRQESILGKYLDEAQLISPQKPPRKWKLFGRTARVGFDSYWGLAGATSLTLSDIMEERFHSVWFAMNGKQLRVINYSYFDQSGRMPWGFAVFNSKMPLYYNFKGIEGSPNQAVIRQTMAEDFGISGFAAYPFNKFNRVEAGFTAKYSKFKTYIDRETIPPGSDLDAFDLLDGSNGPTLRFMTAYVRDTIIYTNSVQGPWHGTGLRAEVEYAPPLGGDFDQYFVLSTDFRRYQHITRGSLIAFRLAGLYSTNASGDFILMGGGNTIRTYPYGSLMGNQGFYTNLEFRFPLLDALIFPKGIGVGPLRGFIFGDYGFTRYNNSLLPGQKQASYGFGLQYAPFNFAWGRRKMDEYKDWKFDFYVSFNY